jgi:hypothetical protein
LIEHPFLSFKEMSDEELLEKTTELHRQLSRAFTWGSSRDLTNQLQWMLEMIEEEKMERYKKQQFEAMQAMFPERVESDPEFKTQKSEIEDHKSTVVKPAKDKKVEMPAPLFHKEYTEAGKKDQK